MDSKELEAILTAIPDTTDLTQTIQELCQTLCESNRMILALLKEISNRDSLIQDLTSTIAQLRTRLVGELPTS